MKELSIEKSDGERIRKAIIKHFKEIANSNEQSWINLDIPYILAWLEKQGELVNSLSKGLDNAHERIDRLIQKNNSLIEQLEKQGEQKDILEDAILDSNGDGLVAETIRYKKEKQGEQNVIPLDKVIKFLDDQLVNDKDEVTGEPFINFRNYGTCKETFISYFKRKMLEKQGEQKSFAKYKIGDTIYYNSFGRLVSFVIANIVEDGTDNPMYEDKDGNSVFQNDIVEQKPVDKVEPKFKNGQWIVFNGLTLYVNEVVQGYYRTISINGIPNSYDWDIDNLARLWNIQDAKDGDVLCYKDEISLYKHDIKNCTKQGTTFGGFVYHCCYDGKGFIMDSLYSLTEQDKMDIHPATKEQRDLLFSKMKEAGYKWDSEKKELKKIEQNPAEWHREDEQNLNACLGYIPDEFLRRWLTDIIHVKYDKSADKVEPKFKNE